MINYPENSGKREQSLIRRKSPLAMRDGQASVPAAPGEGSPEGFLLSRNRFSHSVRESSGPQSILWDC